VYTPKTKRRIAVEIKFLITLAALSALAVIVASNV